MIAELGLRVRAEGAQQATGQLERLTTTAGRAERAATNLNRGVVVAGRGFGNMGPQVQNASFQVADFAVQMASGTSATRAMAQQLPQLLGGFGVMGAAIGAVVAIGGALVPMLFRMGEGAKDAAEAMDDYSEALEDYRDAVDEATAKTEDLIERFGDQAVAMRETLQLMQQLEMQEALEAMRNSVRFVATEFESLFQAVDDFASAQGAISGIGEAFLSSADVRFVEEMRRNLASVASEMGITSDQAVQLRDAIGQIAQASGMDQILSSTAELEQLMLDVFGSVENIPPELRTMLSNVLAAKATTAELAATMDDAEASATLLSNTDMAGPIGAAATAAATLAANLGIAVSQALSLTTLTPAMADEDVVMSQSVIPDAGTRATNRSAVESIGDILARNAKSGRSGGGGGGGVSEAQRELEQFTRTLHGFRTEGQEAAADLAELEAGFARFQGQLTPEQVQLYGQGIDELRDKLRGAGEEGGDFFDIVESNMPRLSELFRDGSNAIADMARSIIDMTFQIAVVEPLINALRGSLGGLSFTPNAKGNAFLNGEVTPFANGGIVNSPTIFPMRNGMGLMGEAGPEAVMPLRRGTDGKLGVEASGGGDTNLNVTVVNQTGVAAEVETRQSGNDVVLTLIRAVSNDIMKGGETAKAMQFRFGGKMRPQGA